MEKIMSLPNCHHVSKTKIEKLCSSEHIQTTHAADLHLRGQAVFEQHAGKAVADWLTWHTRTSWLHKCHFSCSAQNANFYHLTLIFPIFQRRRRQRRMDVTEEKRSFNFFGNTELFRESLLLYKDPRVHKKLSWLSSSKLLPAVQDQFHIHVRAKGLNSEASIQIRSSKKLILYFC